MDIDELRTLLGDLESDRSERTISTNKTDKFGEAICAFANDLPNHRGPGYLFVGVHDDGKPSGTSITDELLRSLSSIRSDGNLLPAPTMTVEKVVLDGLSIAVVKVLPSDLPPVRYKGVVYVRIGPSARRATDADERVLSERRSARSRSWDARACEGAELTDIVLALFDAYRVDAVSREVIEENHRPTEDQLASLRFIDRVAKRLTNAAILLFGKDVLSFVPGAYIQYVRYEGRDATSDVIRERRIDGDLLSMLRELSALASEIENGRPVSIGLLQETMVFDYPGKALREVLVNAVVHRDYESNTPILISHFEDRLEIQNPGGLYDIPREDFPGATAYRNPVVAEAAKTLGFVNRFGRGIPVTQAAMERNGSPAPEFEPTVRHFLVTLRRHA